MSKRRRKRKKPVASAKFQVKDRVRVKHGIKDDDYPDMPIGGWAGAISDVDDDGMYTVRWSRETLDAIHPVFKNRCEKDGLDVEQYRLGEDDLEPDPGGPLDIEQPKEIKTVPLDPEDQDDRIRMVFGLTSNDLLPDVDVDELLTYHDYLSKHMQFPFEVDYFEETGPFEGKWHHVTVLGLFDPDEYSCEEMYGLICKGRVGKRPIEMPLGEFEVDEDTPGLQMLADYCYWFSNYR
jgi:hypothetical protein